MRPFFILSAARSGSTSLARILHSAANGSCLSEPAPTLGRESRQLRDGRRTDAAELVDSVIAPRVGAVDPGSVYGEKNVTLAPFVRAIDERFGARFVHLYRDGRDVVTSLGEWHRRLFGSVYREASGGDEIDPAARAAAAALPAEDDESDYARHRPPAGTSLAERWLSLDRHEMCSYYWAAANAEILTELASVDHDRVHAIDYTSVRADEVVTLAAALGLDGVQTEAVAPLLAARVNSIEDRSGASAAARASWTEWSSEARDRFETHAGALMHELELWDPSQRWAPTGFGAVWRPESVDPNWYEWMFDGRRGVHEHLLSHLATLPPAARIADVGCGIGVGYVDRLADRSYTGIDVSPENIAWCRANRSNPNHDFLVDDVMRLGTVEPTHDLVFSQGTIDNVYDIDDFLRGVVARARGEIWVTAYRGWFPDLDEHEYTFDRNHGCFYNRLSPSRARRTLEALGCREIVVEPIRTSNGSIPFETLIRAQVD